MSEGFDVEFVAGPVAGAGPNDPYIGGCKALADMRRGFNGLATQAAQVLAGDPYSGPLFLFRGRRGEWSEGVFVHQAP